MSYDRLAIRDELKKTLKPSRYEHTLGVSYTCTALAMKYGCDLSKAEMAGLLHDCAKCYGNDTIIGECEKRGIALTETEYAVPAVVHAKLGAYLAKEKFGVSDPEILSAIRCHTTGRPGMSLLDRILYIADYIEPRRKQIPHLDEIRKAAFEDLDEALFLILENTCRYLQETGVPIDDMTEQTYEYYKKLRSSADTDRRTSK